MTNRALRRRGRAALSICIGMAMVAATGCGEKKAGNPDASSDDKDTSDITVAEADEAVTPGGSLTYGIEAETDGFNPISNRWAISGVQIGTAVYDPLSAFDADGVPQPYLAESFEHNEDFTEWTITLRDGVTFHNGKPLTGQEVVELLDAHVHSLLTGFTVAFIDRDAGPDGERGTSDDGPAAVTADGNVVTVKMSAPWATFPTILAGQMGVVPYPDVYNGDDPDGNANPVGTGPFEQKEWIPDDHWTGTKYADYWQKDQAGNQMPYLDEIVFKPTPENTARASAIDSGDLQVMHTTEPSTILDFREKAEEGKVQIAEDSGEGEETFVLLNVSKPPFDDPNARAALAYATDKDEYIATIAPGTVAANGPFAPDSKWYNPEVEEAYPQFDLDKAKEYVEAYKADHGGEFKMTLGNTPSTASREQSDLLAAQWELAGITVDKTTTEQSAYIANSIQGDFQAKAWRQFGEPDPDNGYHWWTGASNLNFARNKDDVIDQALLDGRATDDFDTRKEAYDKVQVAFAEDLPYIWIHHTRWAIVAQNDVRGFTNGPLPSGEPSLPLGSGYSGTARPVYLWLKQ